MPNNPRPRIALDCEESARSRGLMLISALHIAAPDLRDFDLVAANAEDSATRAAIEALTWETGLGVSVHEGAPEAALEHAVLFVAIAVRDKAHLPLAALRERNIPGLVPIQFPRTEVSFDASFLARAAHDPRALADLIVEHVRK